jgi:hypothetical protein
MIVQANLSKLAKATVAVAALGGFLMLAGTPAARASEESECRERVVKADHRLHEAAAKHGWDSPEVAHRRIELKEAREHCWQHGHRWWDEDGQRWHTDRDWDEHDHDRR